MKTGTIYLVQENKEYDKPYLLEFKQLKEYYNFQRRLKSDQKDVNKQNKWIKDEIFLIDKNWLNKWKQFVNYDFFQKKHLNRDLNDNDYFDYLNYILDNKKNIILSPLINSNIYLSNGEINPLADFMIIDKKCQKLFMETRLNMLYKITEKSIPVKFAKDKTIFDIGKNKIIICFQNNGKKELEEIIIIFKNQNNKDKIMNDIENENIISWLKKRNFEIDALDELEIMERGSKIIIINRGLKKKNMINKNKQIQNQNKKENILIGIKFNLTDELKTQIQTEVKKNLSNFKLSIIDDPKIFYSQKVIVKPLNKANSNQINFKENNINQGKSFIPKINIDNNFKISKNEEIVNYERKISSPDLNVHLNLESKTLISDIKYPHKKGLMNQGQSLYINAVVQALSNLKKLTDKLLLNYADFDINNHPLCVTYANLLYMLFHYKETSINHDLYCKICVKLNPIFDKKNEKEVDAKDYLLFMINTMHKELLHETKENINNDIDFLKQEINSMNEKIMLKNCLEKYNSNKTIISELFYGINRFVIKCNECKTCKYDFQTFNILTFSLKELAEYKMQNSKSSKIVDLNLYDAFLYAKEERKLEGENSIYCNKCKKITKGVHKNDIYKLPEILIIVLDRGENRKDYNGDFWFDAKLDFKDKNIIINKDSYNQFYLSGIITFIRKDKNKSNYVAYCRNKEDEKFICYNDEFVEEIDIMNAMTDKTPFILFYHAKN